MNLEQRVQALEEEVQILKNQIQATLLDIQESLLSNTYPTLRSVQIALPVTVETPREPEPAPKMVTAPLVTPQPMPQQPVPQPMPQPTSQPAPAHAKVVSMRDLESQAFPDESPYGAAPQYQPEVYEPVPRMKQTGRLVEPDYMAPPPARPAPVVEEPQAAPPTRRRGKKNDSDELSPSDWAALTKLEDWTRQRVEEIGAPSTRTLIEQYARKRKLAPDVADALIQFIAAFESTTWDEESPSQPDKPSSFLQHFIQEAAPEVDPLSFLNGETNDSSAPFVFDPSVWGTNGKPAKDGSPNRTISGDANPKKTRQQLIGRLIEGLKKVESEV